MVGCPLPASKHSHRARGENKRTKPRKYLHQDKGTFTWGRKKNPSILTEQTAKQRTFLTISHRKGDAQPVSKQSHLRSQNPSCFSTPVFIAEHDVIWTVRSIPLASSGQLSKLCSLPKRESLDTAQILFSSSQNINVCYQGCFSHKVSSRLLWS